MSYQGKEPWFLAVALPASFDHLVVPHGATWLLVQGGPEQMGETAFGVQSGVIYSGTVLAAFTKLLCARQKSPQTGQGWAPVCPPRESAQVGREVAASPALLPPPHLRSVSLQRQ